MATVTITVNPVNDAPVAADDVATTDEDTTLTVAAPGVLANDTRHRGFAVDGDPGLAADQLLGVHVQADGSYSYTPAANFNGTDSFTYTVSDGTADSNVATVAITVNSVNDAPVASDDAESTNEDTPLHVAAPGVLGNDTDTEGSALLRAR